MLKRSNASVDAAASFASGAPAMAVRTTGAGPDLVLFHGGMGCWQHWTRNIGPLAARFTVHALDHPSYGASAPVPRDTTGPEYLDLVHRLFVEMFPGQAPLRLAGFSFGGAIAANLARRLGIRVTHLCLISPGGFPRRVYADRPTRSYREAGNDDARFREICGHNLLVNMLSDPAAVTEETIDIQAYCVRQARFDSRKVSGGGTLLDDLAHLSCRVRLLGSSEGPGPRRLSRSSSPARPGRRSPSPQPRRARGHHPEIDGARKRPRLEWPPRRSHR